MYERTEAIRHYYTNLEYENSKKEALEQIATLAEIVQLSNYNFKERLFIMSDIINRYPLIFGSVCKHIDIVTTMSEYFDKYSAKILLNNKFANELQQVSTIVSILYTIFDICKERVVQFFFNIPSYFALARDLNNLVLTSLYYEASRRQDIILLEDSDLYAVINCLFALEQSLNNIWVQESIMKDFSSLINEHFNLSHFNHYIRSFQSREELVPKCITYGISITSIWSEDIIAAKNLASFLNRDVIFINTHMDFYGTTMFIPYVEFFSNQEKQRLFQYDISKELNIFNIIRSDIETVCLLPTHEIKSASIYNLFYDGMWQKPVKGVYWKCNNNSLWANATSEDVMRCINSAKKGFEIWSTISIYSRLQVLRNLSSILKSNDKHLLANIVLRWTKFPYLCENSRGFYSQDENAEVINSRISKGIIILQAKNENVMFFRLMQILIGGNSVIITFNENVCSLAQYCDIFSTCRIPPGVINLLSNQNLEILHFALCNDTYANYEKQFFSKGTSKETYTVPYLNLTLSKQIMLPLK